MTNYISTAELMQLLRISRTTLYWLTKRDATFPAPKRLTSQKHLWDRDAALAWVASR